MTKDMITMSEIAMLSGQGRSTVGNWKTRQADFPKERGRSSRGPLYDRGEVLEWLRSTGRLSEEHDKSTLAWRLIETLRVGLPPERVVYLAWVLIGLKTICQRRKLPEWQVLVRANDGCNIGLQRACNEHLSFLSEVSEIGVGEAELHGAIVILESLQSDTDSNSELMDELIETQLRRSHFTVAYYSSPKSVRRLVTELSEPKGKVYDPSAGFGQLIADAASSSRSEIKPFAQEIDRRSWELGMLKMLVAGIGVDFRLGNTLTKDAFPQLFADLVLTIPPFNVLVPELADMGDDPRWIYGEPAPRDSNSAWIQHCLFHLAPAGRAFVVLPQNVLFEGGRPGSIRQRIIKADLLDAVISLPAGLFTQTSIPTVLLVFARDRRNKGDLGVPGPILMFDASQLGERPGSRMTTLPEATINRIATTYKSWKTGELVVNDPNSATVDFETIVENKFVIDPRRYILASPPSTDLSALRFRQEKLEDSLRSALAVANMADLNLSRLLERR